MPSSSAPNTRPASSTGTQSPRDTSPTPGRRRNLAARVLRRLRSLPIFRPSTPQYRSVRDRPPTPHPLDGMGGLSVASGSSDRVNIGIWTPIASPDGPSPPSGHLPSAFNTPLNLSNPSPRQLALNPTVDDLEWLRNALEEQRRERHPEGDFDVDPADLDGDTAVGPDDEVPFELEFDNELDGATLVSDRGSTAPLVPPADPATGDNQEGADPESPWSTNSRDSSPPPVLPRVIRRVRRGLR